MRAQKRATQEDLGHTEGTWTGQGEEVGFKRSYEPAKMSRMNDCLAAKVMRFNNLVPRVFSASNMAAAREKTLAHSRSRVSNEDGDVFKMAATAKRVRRTGYEMLR